MYWLPKTPPHVLKATQAAAEAKQYFRRGKVELRFRLQRMGWKSRPFYRFVVMENKKRRGGKYVESLGTFDPLPDPAGTKYVELAVDRVKYWIARGVKHTGRCRRLLEIVRSCASNSFFLGGGGGRKREVKREDGRSPVSATGVLERREAHAFCVPRLPRIQRQTRPFFPRFPPLPFRPHPAPSSQAGIYPALPRTVRYGAEQAAQIRFAEDAANKARWREQAAAGKLEWPTEEVRKRHAIVAEEMQRLERSWTALEAKLRAEGLPVRRVEFE
ncbi:MAG: hypothetical protein BJ554DRAFT_189 [Olpidium bornovanus]|uniref:Ribosomal protein S16 n=1 Tax=Olpidium bornovanus TaxID=278681 RepID=A0A8H7ZUR4_9FUNG|nr:MAG: hypothetical protein BJ554DRAFT_189 [Olpidium bornovanus]